MSNQEDQDSSRNLKNTIQGQRPDGENRHTTKNVKLTNTRYKKKQK